MLSILDHRAVCLFGNGNNFGTARSDFLDVRDHLWLKGVGIARARHDHDYRLPFFNERDRPVLEFTGGKPFGVNIGQLLELERALHGHRESNVATQEKH